MSCQKVVSYLPAFRLRERERENEPNLYSNKNQTLEAPGISLKNIKDSEY